MELIENRHTKTVAASLRSTRRAGIIRINVALLRE
jgi:hypothetical protein